MSQSRLEWKVGVFVVVCLGLLGLLILNFSKGLNWLHKTYELRLTTTNVGGIKAKASVLMAGVPIGSVVEPQLSADGRSVTIRLRIDQRFPIRTNAVFVIEQSGFLGDQFVAVSTGVGDAPLLTNGQEVACQEPFNLQEVARSTAGFIKRIDETAMKVNAAVDKINRIVLNETTLTNLAVGIANFRGVSERARETVAGLSSLVESNRPPIATSVSNLVAFSEQLNHLGEMLDGFIQTNRPALSATVSNFDSASESLKKLMDDLNSGKGLAGGLIEDAKIKADFSLLASNLAVTSDNLNRRGLWGILWKPHEVKTNQPPGASSPKR